MLFCTNGDVKYFNSDLLTMFKKQNSTEVINILEHYCRDFSLDLHQLKDSSQKTLLHYASEYGNVEVVKYLLDNNCEVDAQDNLGMTALMLAVENAKDIVFEVLLRANANIHVFNCKGENALQMIFKDEYSHYEILNTFFNIPTWTEIIMKAIVPYKFARKLEKSGCITKDALLSGDSIFMKELLSYKDVIHSCQSDGKTLLHTAVKKKDIKLIKALIESGANMAALDRWKETPLFYLCEKDYMRSNPVEFLELLKLFMSQSSLLTMSNDRGYMQITHALWFANDDAIDVILKSGIDLYAVDDNGNTVMHYLILNCHINLFKLMRGRKFNVNARNNDGYSPLHMAVSSESIAGIKFLLENEANYNVVDNSRNTPLILTFKYNFALNKEVINIFLQYGVDPQICLLYLVALDEILVRSLRYTVQSDQLAERLVKAESILARLAIVESSRIIEKTHRLINSQIRWKNYFDKCCQEVEDMKMNKIYGKLNMYEFLTANQRKISNYVRNEDFVLKLETVIKGFQVDSPYNEIVRNHLENVIQLAELKEKAINAMCKIVDLEKNIPYDVAENIIEFISKQDMEILVFVCYE